MIEVITAETAGFCFGVERAVRMTEEAADEKRGPVYTLGPVVHNEEVLKALEEKNVRVVDEKELTELPEGILVIRAHGVPESTMELLEMLPLQVRDATCPFVKKIHRIVKEHSERGERILIAGDPEHPEVKGIVGWCGNAAQVLESPEAAADFEGSENEKYCIVSQTTFNYKKFKLIVENIKNKGYNATVADTVCNATRDRQSEAAEISAQADMMIVIGGRNSSNSQKLYSICKEKCNHTYFIQTADDLHYEWFHDVKCVGITAGASTPKNIIKEVQTNVRKF